MKRILNPSFTYLTSALQEIAEGQYRPDRIFCDSRNRVELLTVGKEKIVIKHYKKVNFLRGFVYTFFRKTKARKAFENAMFLIGEGIATPEPIAYLEKHRYGLFSTGIFISRYCPLPAVSETIFNPNVSEEELHWLCHNLSLFTLHLHLKGIQPLDYNSNNILYERTDPRTYRFTLIDINRMQVGKVPDFRQSMRSFFQVGAYDWNYDLLLKPYAEARSFNFQECEDEVERERQKWFFKKKISKLFSSRSK